MLKPDVDNEQPSKSERRNHSKETPGGAVSAPALTMLAVILSHGAISGAHLNPAVSVAFAPGDTWRGAACRATYSQPLGGTFAVLLLLAAFERVGSLGATVPGNGINDTRAI
jgi:aquaporin Z